LLFYNLDPFGDSELPNQNSKTQIIDNQKYEISKYFKQHVIQNKMNLEQAKKAAFEEVLVETALIEKGEELGIKATLEEAKQTSKEMRQRFENAEEGDPAVEANKQMIKGLGLSEDEYWNEYLIKNYIDLITIENVREHVIGELENEKKVIKTDENAKAYDEKVKVKWETYVNDTVKEFKDKNKNILETFKKKNKIKE
jgi:hypothetical protein